MSRRTSFGLDSALPGLESSAKWVITCPAVVIMEDFVEGHRSGLVNSSF